MGTSLRIPSHWYQHRGGWGFCQQGLDRGGLLRVDRKIEKRNEPPDLIARRSAGAGEEPEDSGKGRREHHDTGCENTLGQFAALIHLCDLVVTGDTTALHIAIGLRKKSRWNFLARPVRAKSNSTAGGEKVITPLSCAPCYRRSCDITPNCMERIPIEDVMNKIRFLCSGPGG